MTLNLDSSRVLGNKAPSEPSPVLRRRPSNLGKPKVRSVGENPPLYEAEIEITRERADGSGATQTTSEVAEKMFRAITDLSGQVATLSQQVSKLSERGSTPSRSSSLAQLTNSSTRSSESRLDESPLPLNSGASSPKTSCPKRRTAASTGMCSFMFTPANSDLLYFAFAFHLQPMGTMFTQLPWRQNYFQLASPSVQSESSSPTRRVKSKSTKPKVKSLQQSSLTPGITTSITPESSLTPGVTTGITPEVAEKMLRAITELSAQVATLSQQVLKPSN